jgi:spermidine/putrescine-binding protein
MLRLAVPLLFAMTPLLSCAEEVIRVYNWNDYIAPQVLVDFTAQTGIKVDYQTFSTSEELEAALIKGEAIDVAVSQHNSLPMLIEKKLIKPLDYSQLPNRKHIDKQLLSTLTALDPNNQHALPYQWGDQHAKSRSSLRRPFAKQLERPVQPRTKCSHGQLRYECARRTG